MHLIDSVSDVLSPWVGAHPLMALGIAAVVGLFLGFLAARAIGKKEKH